ncbi:hypothetical protein LX64_05178 [Chitinophaga skermanii]|uniref:PKD domain-containing protein n=1 Tax=Chitinophaga skermanii TaxID=331697 RepID=A0A327PY01_9BACT|nr:hypothetical protein [Chitinophaga skermanii]RAI96998.1 hypothetical protein LX64_05178 [Chitinophaga skermanii]
MKYLIGFLMCYCLVGCDNREESLSELNSPPEIFLQAQAGGPETKELIDSVKLSNTQFGYLPIVIRVQDLNSNIKSLRMSMVSGDGLLKQNDDEFTDTIRILGNKGIYKFIPAHPGAIIVRFVVTDYFNQRDSAQLKVFAFNNLAPIANLRIDPIGEVERFEYLLDGSLSYDPDKNLGGGLTKYIFIVNNTTIAETRSSAIPFIFPSPGAYICKLRVVDNDGAVSKEVVQSIQIQ